MEQIQQRVRVLGKDVQKFLDNDKSPVAKYVKLASSKTGIAPLHLAAGMTLPLFTVKGKQ